MDRVAPWNEVAAVMEPYCPKATSAGGRPPVELEGMLPIHCLQLWFCVSDPAVEEALHGSLAMRFGGLAKNGIAVLVTAAPADVVLVRYTML